MSAAAATELRGACTATGKARVSLALVRWPRVPLGKLNASRPAEAAAIYQALGLAPLPIRRKDKRPADNDWKDLVAAKAYDPSFFSDGGNLALALGPQSRDLADLDIDSDDPNVPRLAAEFLPATVMFGREGRRASHRLYVCPGAVTVDLGLEGERGRSVGRGRGAREQRGESKRQHVEIRGAGLITVVPPGTHLSDQPIRFESGADRVAEISADALRSGVGKVVAGAVLARAWPERGARHDFRLALAGALLGGGWSQEQVRDFLVAVARLVDDDENDLLAAIRSTAGRELRTGWPTLAKLLRSYETPLGATSGEQAAKLIRDALFPAQLNGAAPSLGAASCYEAREGVGMVHVKQTANGPVEVPLSDFTARIVADIGRDDGAEVKRAFRIEAHCRASRHEFDVATERFASMAWVLENLGTSGTILAGAPTKDHLRAAILQLSQETAQRRVEYTHTGWREVNGEHVYLHGGGAIGKNGPADGVAVSLPSQLAPFAFPSETSAADLTAAVRSAWRLPLVLGKHRAPLLLQAAVFRSVLPLPCNFSVFVVGPTGVYKSQLAAITQQHFGAAFTDKNLPGSWSSTANATEVLAFAAKDAVLVVDDFAPNGSSVDVNRYHQQAERLFRAQGNGSGRGRLSADASLRATKAPRGLIIATGEDVPRGQSIRARLLVLEMTAGSICSESLSQAQQAASAGVYASALGGFVAWIAARFEDVRGEASRLTLKYRAEATEHGAAHRRTPDIVAQLLVAAEMFGRFALSVGAASASEVQERGVALRQALDAAGSEQAAHQAAAEPTVQFLDALRAALTMGEAHLANAGVSGGAPQYDADALGWRRLSDQSYVPTGKCIGWVAGTEDLYLEPGASYAVAQEIARKSATTLGVTPRTLHKRLAEKGLLLSTEVEARGTLAVRKMIQGRRLAVLHLPRRALVEGTEGQS